MTIYSTLTKKTTNLQNATPAQEQNSFTKAMDLISEEQKVHIDAYSRYNKMQNLKAEGQIEFLGYIITRYED